MREHYQPLTLVLVMGPLIVGSGSVYANNWMRSEDEGYYTTSLEYDTTSDRWNQDNKLETMSCTPKNWKFANAYEYGWSYYRTIFGSLDYLDRNCGENEASGIGDLTLGIRSRLDIYRNGRTWEAAVNIPTGYSTSGGSSIGSGLYGFKLGAYGSFGDRHRMDRQYGSNVELGTNVTFWEGSAAEQLSAYIKYNFAATEESHFNAAIEGDYALINRSKDLTSTVNPVSDFGYDRLNFRIGYSRRATLYWRVSFEASNVLWGRNTNDSNSVRISFSRSYMD